jgi:voltage-gated potassium channel
LKKFSERNKYSVLLFFLFFAIALTPIITDYFDIRIIFFFAISLVAISAIQSMTGKKTVFHIGLILLFFLIVILWASFVSQSFIVNLFYYIIHITFFSYITVNIFYSTYRSTTVNQNVVHGAIVVYLMIGLCFSFTYGLVEFLRPGSFSNISAGLAVGHRPFLYFSFVTLTTLGYGDIVPLTDVARSLAVLEAVIGQVYLIINVSWLVGLYVAHTREQRKP